MENRIWDTQNEFYSMTRHEIPRARATKNSESKYGQVGICVFFCDLILVSETRVVQISNLSRTRPFRIVPYTRSGFSNTIFGSCSRRETFFLFWTYAFLFLHRWNVGRYALVLRIALQNLREMCWDVQDEKKFGNVPCKKIPRNPIFVAASQDCHSRSISSFAIRDPFQEPRFCVTEQDFYF